MLTPLWENHGRSNPPTTDHPRGRQETHNPAMNDLILYTTDDGRSQIKLRTKDQTVWLSQREMALLFDVSTDNVGLHLKNIVAEGDLEEGSVAEESSVTAADGKQYRTKLYNLDAILAVGYRVRSPRGVQFRRWAGTVLKEYLVKGFVMDDIAKIVATYQHRQEEPRYSRRVAMSEIASNDFNLNISRYISTAQAEEEIDLAATHSQLLDIEKAIRTATAHHNTFLKELGLPPLP